MGPVCRIYGKGHPVRYIRKKSGIFPVFPGQYGLENLDREILHIIIDRFNGGPVGIDTIAASIGEERVTIEDAYEPYLIQAGFLHRTQKGRVVSEKAYRHLGLTDNRAKADKEKNFVSSSDLKSSSAHTEQIEIDIKTDL